MTELFWTRGASPMLIGRQEAAFDGDDWIYELKLDGFRCLAYVEGQDVDLRNKRNLRMLSHFPELAGMGRQVEGPCILDGEIVVLRNGVPDFYTLQRRTLLTDPFKIQVEAARFPASFVAFDCLSGGGRELLEESLTARKEMLHSLVKENERIALSRSVEGKGLALYQAACQMELEGIVAKKKDSQYWMGKRSREWIKCKRMADEEFVVAGYLRKGVHTYSLVLAKYKNKSLVYKGHVTAGVTREAIVVLKETEQTPFRLLPTSKELPVWVKPDHVCLVEYMPNTRNALRQPVFKGYRLDVRPEEVEG